MSSDALAHMTPEQLAKTPAAKPPKGVIPNLVNPHSEGHVLIIVGSIFMAIMFIFSGIRFYMKLFVRRKTTADDWTTLAAIVWTIWYFGICVHAVTDGKFGTHMWDISLAHIMSKDFLIASFFSNWVTAVVWALAKTSFFLMYLQIFGPLIWLRICVYIGLFVNWGFYLAVCIASFYFMVPNPGQTWQEGFRNERYGNAINMTIPIATGSLTLDLYIFLLPLIAVSKLQLSQRKRLGVMAVFATGFCACIASSVSLVLRDRLNKNHSDYTYSVYPVFLVSLMEMCLGISCSCMPSTAGFFKSMGEGSGSFSLLLRSVTRFGSGKSSKQNSSLDGSGKNWTARKDYTAKSNQYINLGEAPNNHIYRMTDITTENHRV